MGGICPQVVMGGEVCPLGGVGWRVGRVCPLGVGWMGSVHLVGARRPGLSTGAARVSWPVHWAGRVPGLALGHAGQSLDVSWVWARRVARLPSGSLHFRCALLPTHLTRGHGCVRERALLPPQAPGSHQVVALVCAQRAGRWWGLAVGAWSTVEEKGSLGSRRQPGRSAWRLEPGAGCQGGGLGL